MPKKIGVIACLLVVLITPITVLKFPVRQELLRFEDHHYFQGLLGIYYRSPRMCGWLGCWEPDLPFLRDRWLVRIDPFTFSFAGSTSTSMRNWTSWSDLYTDRRHVVIQDEVIPGSDPRSLVFKEGFAFDSRYVYTGEGVFLVDNPQTFQRLECGFFRDDAHLYSIYYENIAQLPIQQFRPIPVDLPSFRVIAREQADCFQIPYIAEDDRSFLKKDTTYDEIHEFEIVPKAP